MDLVIAAYWGMARLCKVTYQRASGPPCGRRELATEDASFHKLQSGNKRAVILLRDAKTAKPGERQKIRLYPVGNLLCPVEALKRRLNKAGGPGRLIFGYRATDGTRRNLTRAETSAMLERVWKEGGYTKLTGHSFRVGGDSFRYAMEVPVDKIKKLGRWESDCYQLYIRPYTPTKTWETKKLVEELDACWAGSK